MDVLPMCSIFQELQIVHDTGYFSALPSLEEYWQQFASSVDVNVLLQYYHTMRCQPVSRQQQFNLENPVWVCRSLHAEHRLTKAPLCVFGVTLRKDVIAVEWVREEGGGEPSGFLKRTLGSLSESSSSC